MLSLLRKIFTVLGPDPRSREVCVNKAIAFQTIVVPSSGAMNLRVFTEQILRKPIVKRSCSSQSLYNELKS